MRRLRRKHQAVLMRWGRTLDDGSSGRIVVQHAAPRAVGADAVRFFPAQDLWSAAVPLGQRVARAEAFLNAGPRDLEAARVRTQVALLNSRLFLFKVGMEAIGVSARHATRQINRAFRMLAAASPPAAVHDCAGYYCAHPGCDPVVNGVPRSQIGNVAPEGPAGPRGV